MLKKAIVLSIKKLDNLSAVSVRLVKLTGKHPTAVHPKHLVSEVLWFDKYLQKEDRVLDLGSSSGQISIKMAKKVKDVIGVEISGELIKIAENDSKNIRNIRFVHYDLNKNFPFIDNSFDKIICSDILEHIKDGKHLLKEIRRVLKKGGFLILATDNPDTLWKRLQKSVGLNYYADPEHTYEYSQDEIVYLLSKIGFKIIDVGFVTYDTPFKGLIDLTGGISLYFYKKMRKWRENMVHKHPEETVGYRIVAQKI